MSKKNGELYIRQKGQVVCLRKRSSYVSEIVDQILSSCISEKKVKLYVCVINKVDLCGVRLRLNFRGDC